jgi:hypothetical protein
MTTEERLWRIIRVKQKTIEELLAKIQLRAEQYATEDAKDHHHG